MKQQYYGIDLIRELSMCFGPSGCEDEVRRVICEQIGDAASVTTDKAGNLIALVHGHGLDYKADDPDRLMVCAHMDEVGFMVREITEEGYLKFAPIGGMDPRVLCGRHVRMRDWATLGREMSAVIATKAIHMQTAEERSRVTPVNKMYMDIGAQSAEEAERYASVGDCGVFDSDFVTFGKENAFLKGKALDGRLGCAAMIEVIRDLYNSPADMPFDVYFAFTCRQEVGISGASVAAHVVNPTMAWTVGATDACDLPDIPESSRAATLGGGCVLSLADRTALYDPALTSYARRCAESNGIACQIKQGLGGISDGGRIQRSMAGIPTVSLSVPVRYPHTASVTACLSDYTAVRELLRVMLRSWEP
jgi:putative aminopeptidase FrvX